eukprot:4207509-Pleurochrysis_carterae.AAC.2
MAVKGSTVLTSTTAKTPSKARMLDSLDGHSFQAMLDASHGLCLALVNACMGDPAWMNYGPKGTHAMQYVVTDVRGRHASPQSLISSECAARTVGCMPSRQYSALCRRRARAEHRLRQQFRQQLHPHPAHHGSPRPLRSMRQTTTAQRRWARTRECGHTVSGPTDVHTPTACKCMHVHHVRVHVRISTHRRTRTEEWTYTFGC